MKREITHMVAVHVAEALSGADGERLATSNTFQAHDGTGLRRPEFGATLLPLPAGRRLRPVRLGLGDRSAPLLGLLLLRRVPVPVHADARPGHARSPAAAAAAAAAADGRTAGPWRRRRSVLFTEACLVHLDALLRQAHEHRLRTTTGNGR